ncbi:MAG: hypothetical protein ACKO15_16385 [Burkholderiales bacterium]
MKNPIGNPVTGVISAIGDAVDAAYAAQARSTVGQAVRATHEWAEYAASLEARLNKVIEKNKQWEAWGQAMTARNKALEDALVVSRKARDGLVAVKDALIAEARDCPNTKHHHLAYSEEGRARIHISVSGGNGLFLPPELQHLSAAPTRLSGN